MPGLNARRGWRAVTALAATAVLLLCGPSLIAANGLRAELERLVRHGGVAVGPAASPRLVHRPGAYVPASIVKLATALAAFHLLGSDYRFRTEVYLDGARNLILRGYGDPFLVSEEWALIAQELAAAGTFDQPLGDLVLDTSAYRGVIEVDGAEGSLNPYDARLGPLVSNFNTIHVDVAAGGAVTSAEPQTPLTPIATELGRGLAPGRHRINISQDDARSLRYTGELARAMLANAGAVIQGRVREGAVPAGLAPILVHRASRPLSEVVRAMLEFSNNFIANQMVMAMGLEASGAPGDLEQGVAEVEGYLVDELGLPADAFTLLEGSGLSRKNRFDLLAMVRVVEAFHPWAHLLRTYGKAPRRARAKTGTLTGVQSLAGFLPGREGPGLPFVIMLNQDRNTRGAIYRRLAAAYGEK